MNKINEKGINEVKKVVGKPREEMTKDKIASSTIETIGAAQRETSLLKLNILSVKKPGAKRINSEMKNAKMKLKTILFLLVL